MTLTANALDISPILANPDVGAVLHAGVPSMATRGVVDVLFGDAVPAGRTIATVHDAGAWQGQVSILDMGMRPGPSPFPRPDCPAHTAKGPHACPNATNPGRTHRFYTGTPVRLVLVCFGFVCFPIDQGG